MRTQVNQSGVRPGDRRENRPTKTQSLQVRLALLVVFITSPALLLVGFLSLYAADRAVAKILDDRAARVAEWLEDTFSLVDLKDDKAVQKEVDRLSSVRSGLRDVVVFSRNDESGALSSIASRQRFAMVAPLPNDEAAARRDVVFKRRDESGWEIAVPLHRNHQVVGVVRAEVSLPDHGDELVADARIYLSLTTIGAVGLTGLALVIALGRAIGRPVEQLVDVMERARQGELDAQVPVTHLDEFGWLGENFNRMLRKLKENDERQARFNEELRSQVAAATVELARKNEELARANHRLFEAQRALGNSERLASLGQLASQMAHEIGTPLNSIYGHIQLLAADEIPDAAKKRIAIVESQVERLTKIIENVLRTLRLPDAQLREVEVSPVLRGIATFMQPVAESRKIELKLALDDGLPKVYADSRQLEQVLLNLITNAIDAMPEGGVLTIEAEAKSADLTGTSSGEGRIDSGSASTSLSSAQQLSASSASTDLRPAERKVERDEHVLVRVRDTGIGIAPENLHRIFEPFFTTKAPGTGTGLGLPICQQILRAFRGSLSVASDGPGKGACFTVKLPAVRSEPPREPVPAPPVQVETITTDSSASDLTS